MTFTAMRPDLGLSNGREVSLLSVAQASSLISAFSVVLSDFVRVVRAQEIGVADEEAFLVVVGVDEPAGDAVGAVAADFAGVGMEDVHAVDLDLDLAVLGGQDVDVGLAEDDEEVAFAGVLEVVGHVQIGVHAGLQHGDAAELVELRGVGVVVEGAGDQHVEAGIAGFAGGGDQIGARDGAEFRADEDGGALFCAARLRDSGLRRRPGRPARE